MDEKKLITGAAKTFKYIKTFEDENAQLFGTLQVAAMLVAYKRLFRWKRFFMPSWWKIRRYAKAVFCGKEPIKLQRFGWDYLDPAKRILCDLCVLCG